MTRLALFICKLYYKSLGLNDCYDSQFLNISGKIYNNMLIVEQKKSKRGRRVVLGIIVVVLIVIAVGWFVNDKFINKNTDKNKSTDTSEKVKTVPKTSAISSNILFTGNIYWGRYINDWSMASPLKYAYPFSRLSEFDRNSYNAWISGLECPTKTGVSMTSAEEDATLTFNCSPDYLPEAAKWFTVVTLANNHTDNQGLDGFEETKEQLEKNGIQYFGHYDPTVIDDICEVIAVPVTVEKDDGSKSDGKLPVATCGYHGVFQLPPQESVDVMQQYAEYMPVIAMPHMGAEYKTAPDELKISFYRGLIDGGADMVIGDHPHWIQNTESYNGHLIVYSMGNFIFDQQDTVEVTRSAAIHLLINDNDDDSDLLDKWLALGKTCGSFKDDCLEQATNQGLKKLDLTYRFGVVGSNDGDKINKPATAEQQSAILERLNWQTTIDQLQEPYGSL